MDESFPGVPRLLESLRRVWFVFDLGDPASTILDGGLTQLQADHESGARQLAGIALGVFIRVLKQLDMADEEIWWANVRRVAWHLWKNGRESMGAPILSVMLSSLETIHAKMKNDGLSQRTVEDIVTSLEDLGQQRETSTSKIANSFTTFLQQYPPEKPINIVTLSSSSTITSCLTHALTTLPHKMDIRILESRPLYEGAKLAYKLSSYAASHNIPIEITVMTDAAAGIAAHDADLLLIGADLIDKYGNVSNKTGSLPAVLAARHVSKNVKVVVVSEKEKVLPFEAPGHEENDVGEVTGSWDGLGVKSEEGVKVRNVYFEWVDNGLVDAYVTDDGVSGTEDVRTWAGDIERRANCVFEGL